MARHKSRPDWLVVDLMKVLSTDRGICQILRFMGWVIKILASPGEEVKGLILSSVVVLNRHFALAVFPPGYIRVMCYRVHLFLEPVWRDDIKDT